MNEFVYIIKEDKKSKKNSENKPCIYKIGKSVNPPERKKGLQTGNSTSLKLEKSFECINSSVIETQIHKMLGDKNIRGEWFKLNSEELEQCKKDIQELIKNEKPALPPIGQLEKEKLLITENVWLPQLIEKNLLSKEDISENPTIKKNPKTLLYECEECGYRTNRVFNFNKHNESLAHLDNIKHNEEKNNEKNDGKNEEQKEVQNEEQNEENNQDKIVVTCEYCSQTFSRTSSLTRHHSGRCAKKKTLEIVYLSQKEKNEIIEKKEKEIYELKLENAQKEILHWKEKYEDLLVKLNNLVKLSNKD